MAADVHSSHVYWSHSLSSSVGIRGRRADGEGAPSRPQPRRAPSAGRAAPAGGGGSRAQQCPVTAVTPCKDCQHLPAPSLQLQQQLPAAAAPRPGCKAQPCHWGRHHGTHPAAVAAMVALAAARHILRQCTHSECKLRSECRQQVFSLMDFQCGQKLFNAALDYRPPIPIKFQVSVNSKSCRELLAS